MASIQIFDPALCCSTGVCGVEVDQGQAGLVGGHPVNQDGDVFGNTGPTPDGIEIAQPGIER